MVTPANKTSNMYAVTATFKKAAKGIENMINKEGIKYANELINLIEQKLKA